MAEPTLAEPLVDKERASSVCLDWDEGEPEVQVTNTDGSPAEQGEEGGMFVAICSLLAAIPALIGSWCWPILVGAIFAVAAGNVNGGLVDFFHGVQVAIMFGLMTNIVQFAYWKCAKKKVKSGKHWDKWGPVYVLMVATVLVLIQPTCMLVIGSWTNYSGNVAYDTAADVTSYTLSDGTTCTGGTDNCALDCGEPLTDGIDNFFFDGDDNPNALTPNTTTGWMIQIFGTYLGFGFLFWGVIWATNLHVKISKKWAQIRRNGGAPATATMA